MDGYAKLMGRVVKLCGCECSPVRLCGGGVIDWLVSRACVLVDWVDQGFVPVRIYIHIYVHPSIHSTHHITLGGLSVRIYTHTYIPPPHTHTHVPSCPNRPATHSSPPIPTAARHARPTFSSRYP